MIFKNLKLFFLFFIVLIISQSVLCQDNGDKEGHTAVGNGPEEVTSSVQPHPTEHETTPPVTTPPTTTPPTTTPPTTTPPTTTPPTTKPSSSKSSSSPTPSQTPSQAPQVPNTNPDQIPNDIPQQPQPQQPIEGNQTVDPSTNTSIGTINTSGANKTENKKDEDGVPTIYIFLGIGIILVLVAAVVGFIFAVQKKKKNNNEPLSPNMWSVPDDFDSRINPVAQPANTYNMNNVQMSQPQMSQPLYPNSYGQAPVMSEAYNQVQPAYVDQNDMQMPPSNGVAVTVDNGYPNDYNNGGAGEYIPTSVEELKVNNVYVSQFTFQPELDDEIEINVDDQIYIEEIFADNWALGVNTTTNVRGCFPLNIFLNPKSTLDNSRSQRTLSYCSSGNGQPY